MSVNLPKDPGRGSDPLPSWMVDRVKDGPKHPDKSSSQGIRTHTPIDNCNRGYESAGKLKNILGTPKTKKSGDGASALAFGYRVGTGFQGTNTARSFTPGGSDDPGR